MLKYLSWRLGNAIALSMADALDHRSHPASSEPSAIALPIHRSLFVWLSADRNLLKWLTFMVWRNLDDDFLVEFIARRIRRWIKRFQKGLAVELLFQQSRSHFA
jgi:hypothetical protein